MAIGASVGGLLADRFGRRQVFAVTLLVYGLATGASALVGGLAALLVLRFLVGLGLGAELPVASTYVSEFAPARMRGRLIVILEAFWAVGWTAAALIGFLVIPGSDDGWRWAFALGAIPAAYALVVRWGLPESARWLARRGRSRRGGRRRALVRGSPPGVAEPADRRRARRRGAAPPRIVRARAPRRPVVARSSGCAPRASGWCGSASTSRTTARSSGSRRSSSSQGYDLVRSFGFTLIITLAQLPGYAVAAWLIEVWGRRLTLSVFLAGSAVAAVFFGTATGESAVIATGMALSFFNLGAWGALYAVTPEMYPTSLRATGSGWAAGVGRIASIVAPLTVPLLLALGGAPLLFVVFAAFFAIAAGGGVGAASTAAGARSTTAEPAVGWGSGIRSLRRDRRLLHRRRRRRAARRPRARAGRISSRRAGRMPRRSRSSTPTSRSAASSPGRSSTSSSSPRSR